MGVFSFKYKKLINNLSIISSALKIGFRRPAIDNEKVSRYLRDMYERMMLASMSMKNYIEFDLVHMLLEAIVWPKAE